MVAPYATMLALDVAGEECIGNLKRLKELGAFGTYGFYESIDFNVPNSVELTSYCIVKSYMAHHQGMNLAAIDNYLNQGIFRKRFHGARRQNRPHCGEAIPRREGCVYGLSDG